MKRVLILVLVAIITFVLFALYKNFDVLKDLWIWLLGFAGVIVALIRDGSQYVMGLFNKKGEKKDDKENKESKAPVTKKEEKISHADVKINLYRYSDDGETTVGLLYINDKFFCYTLEDAFRPQKIAGETRIPAGSFDIGFNRNETPLTERYRTRFPEWFTYHIELKNVPQFNSIYIHNGGDHTNTEGCILVSDSLSVGDAKTFLTNSRKTFKTLYKFLNDQLNQNKKIVIKIEDEGWVKKLAS